MEDLKPKEPKKLGQIDVKSILRPDQYLTPSAEYNAGQKKFSATVTAAKDLDPPCEVTLDLPPGRRPELVPSARVDQLKGVLKAGVKTVELFAGNLVFQPRKDMTGYAHVSADGVPRAFVFKTDFSPSTDLVPAVRVTGPAVRVLAPPYVL